MSFSVRCLADYKSWLLRSVLVNVNFHSFNASTNFCSIFLSLLWDINYSYLFRAMESAVKTSVLILLLFFLQIRKFLKNFTTNEIIKWSTLCKEYESGLKAGENATFVFSSSSKVEGGDKRWADLKNRVVEHVSDIASRLRS